MVGLLDVVPLDSLSVVQSSHKYSTMMEISGTRAN
jgi:hypothetical protein